MNGLTEDGAFLMLHQLLLSGLAQSRPKAKLLGCQVHCCLLLILAVRKLNPEDKAKQAKGEYPSLRMCSTGECPSLRLCSIDMEGAEICPCLKSRSSLGIFCIR